MPKNLAIVIERPDLYTITCNGKPVAGQARRLVAGQSLRQNSARGVAHTGENIVTIKASPFTIYHELEPAYVLGDFTLKPVDRGFVIAPEQPLALKPATTTTSLTHSVNSDGTMWLSSGIGAGNGADDRAPFVVFDLGRDRDLSALRIWNYCEAHVQNLTSRGAKEVRVTAAPDSSTPAFGEALGTFTLKRGNPSGGSLESLPVTIKGVRFIRLEILSKQDGVTFPAVGQPEDNGYVGLAEVQFVAADGRPIEGVKIKQASSELPSHQRLAKHLVDGSGLTSNASGGWNSQGHPFYSAGVGYRQEFKVAKREGKFTVALPQWLGSVAKVSVNGKLAGYIDAPPWECDVTKRIKRGQNNIEVTVIGTLEEHARAASRQPGARRRLAQRVSRRPESRPAAGRLILHRGLRLV